MALHPLSADQVVSPAQVWADLSADLQVQVIRLLAELATHLVIAQEEPVRQARKERLDACSPIDQQDPA